MYRTNFRLARIMLLMLPLFVSACVSTKKLTYLQDDLPSSLSTPAAAVKMAQIKAVTYRLQPNDRLLLTIFSLTDEKVNFLKNPELELGVDDAGQIRLPVMGPVVVSGLTIQQAEERLKQTATAYLRNPEVSIKLLNAHITVLGEVFRQGAFPVADSKVTILEAIGYAGGVTENANMQTIRIIRNVNDTATIYRVNLLADNLLSSTNYFLQPNDIVLVNPMKAKATNQQRLALISIVVSIISTLAWILK